ncbi:Hypothetical protein CINCED_3A000677 [Cinara cedri]|uniref:Cytochrome P450 n=1 Tax=Cinara cedri TaxID=506608 RepID=A0A5E4MQ19_9HEMI|nr:Hypothetical protein CINCED_3A000677 [Cinara cedri]
MIPYILIDWLFDSVVLSLFTVITIIYYLSTSTYDKWRKLNVQHIHPVPLFGNVFKMIMGLEDQITAFGRIYRRFPNSKICGFYQMRTPFLMIRDPELIDAITIKDFSHFTDHGLEFDPSINLLARSLFFANGQKWKVMRQKLSPGFTSGKLKCTNDQIKECSDQLIQFVDEKLSKQSDGFDVKEIFGKFTTDVIGTCAFGLKLDTITDSDSNFRKYLNEIFGNNFKQTCIMMLGMVFPKVVKFFKLRSFPLEASNFFYSVFTDVIDYRTKNSVVRNDLAQTLMEARKELVLNGDNATGDEKFTDLDIISNAILLFTAGAETVSVTAAFCLYELALNRDIQNKLRDEINSKNEKYGGQFTNEFLMDLHYADMVLEETHRMYSITVNIIRQATQTFKVPGMDSFIIEKGQKIVIPMSSIHHDPKYYPNPKTFDPERFTKEEKSKRPNSTFLPFGEGPRHCIGMYS